MPPGCFLPIGNSFLQRLCSTGMLQVLLIQKTHLPCRGCLQRGKPLNHTKEQDLDHARHAPRRLHSRKQVGSMLQHSNNKQKGLQAKCRNAGAITLAGTHKATLPLRQVLHRLAWEHTPRVKCSTG